MCVYVFIKCNIYNVLLNVCNIFIKCLYHEYYVLKLLIISYKRTCIYGWIPLAKACALDQQHSVSRKPNCNRNGIWENRIQE